MNCVECQDKLVAWVEGLLDAEQSELCRAHMEHCAQCHAEYIQISRLQEHLVARGEAAAEVSVVSPVLRQIRQVQSKKERIPIMTKLFSRWGVGLGATATAVAAIILIMALVVPKASARAADVMRKGAQVVASLKSLHLRGQVRSAPGENFSHLDPELETCRVEVWKQFEPNLKWRIEKPGRVALMDGQSTLLYLKKSNQALKVPKPAPSAFDTSWLHAIADLSETLMSELERAKAKGWKLELAEVIGNDSQPKSIVTVHAKSGLPEDDYLKNKFFDNADTRRVYRFDARTGQLEAVQIYLARQSGDLLIFDLNTIEYDQAIDPSVWQIEMPADVGWIEEPQPLADNVKYASMTPEQVARAFFEACGREDWQEASKFMSPVPSPIKKYLAGVKLVSIGTSFSSKAYPGWFVPYEIRFRNGETKKFNLAIRKDNPAHRWQVDGGI